MNQVDFKAFSEHLSSVADYYGKPLTAAGVEIYWNALRGLELAVIRRLLSDHVNTSRFMPTVAELLDRIKAMDGRPGAEEAWAMIPKDEAGSVVWTDEMAEAFAVADPLLQEGESIPARMAFLERYRALIQHARDTGKAARWTPSLGHDVACRERILLEAARLGRITPQHAAGLLPHRDQAPPELVALMRVGGTLPAPKDEAA
jgi:hypothetical protein